MNLLLGSSGHDWDPLLTNQTILIDFLDLLLKLNPFISLLPITTPAFEFLNIIDL